MLPVTEGDIVFDAVPLRDCDVLCDMLRVLLRLDDAVSVGDNFDRCTFWL